MLKAADGAAAPGRIGLSSGIDPSRLMRRTLPLRLLGSWARFSPRAVLASPIVTQMWPAVVHLHRAAVVMLMRPHAGEQRRTIQHQRGASLDAEAQQLVLGGHRPLRAIKVAGGADIRERVAGEVTVDRHAQAAALAEAQHVRDRGGPEEFGVRRGTGKDVDAAHPLGDEHAAVGQEGEIPRDRQAVLEHGHLQTGLEGEDVARRTVRRRTRRDLVWRTAGQHAIAPTTSETGASAHRGRPYSGKKTGIRTEAERDRDQVQRYPDPGEVGEPIAAQAVDHQVGLIAERREERQAGSEHDGQHDERARTAPTAAAVATPIGNMRAAAALWETSSVRTMEATMMAASAPNGAERRHDSDQSAGEDLRQPAAGDRGAESEGRCDQHR